MLLIIKTIELLLLLFLALICDIKTYKIKNSITLTFTALGIITNVIAFRIEGFKISILGWSTAVALLFILYVFKMLGAGDIKLFGAIGAIMGYKFVMNCIVASFLFGGIIGLGFLLARKNSKDRFKYFYNYAKSCMLSYSFLEYSDFGNTSIKDKFRFSYAFVPGTILQIVLFLLA